MKRLLMAFTAIAVVAGPVAPLPAFAQEDQPQPRRERPSRDRGERPQISRDDNATPRFERPQQPRPEHPSRPTMDVPRPERPNRPEGGWNRPDRPNDNGGDRPNRPDRPNGGWNRPDRPNNSGGERPNRPDRPEGGWNRPDRPGGERPDRPDRPEGGWNRPDRPGGDWNRPDRPNVRSDQPNRPGWNHGRDRDHQRNEFRRRFDSDQWRRDFYRNHRSDWWRNDRRFRGYTGVRVGFYFAPGWGYYSVPRSYWGRSWSVGQYLPDVFWRYQLNDWRTYGLGYPPEGTRWVSVDNTLYLIDEYDGYIIDVIRDAWRW